MKILLFNLCNRKETKTRLHSSRMRTARLLPVSPSKHCTGGVSAPGGVCSQGVYLPGETCLGGVPAQGCTMWPVPSYIWCYPYAAPSPTETHQQCSCLYIYCWLVMWPASHAGILPPTPPHPPPQWTEFLTQASENITLTNFVAGGKN